MSGPAIIDERAKYGNLYRDLMREILKRLDAVAEALRAWESDASKSQNWEQAEFCYLQIRKTCEIIALSCVVAHGEIKGGYQKTLLKEWKAGELIKKILEFNSVGFPLPVDLIEDANEGSYTVQLARPHILPGDIEEIYGICGDKLHVGNLKRILAGQMKTYSMGQIKAWRNRIILHLNTHMIFLHEFESVLFVSLKEAHDGDVHCAFGDTDGGFLQGRASSFELGWVT